MNDNDLILEAYKRINESAVPASSKIDFYKVNAKIAILSSWLESQRFPEDDDEYEDDAPKKSGPVDVMKVFKTQIEPEFNPAVDEDAIALFMTLRSYNNMNKIPKVMDRWRAGTVSLYDIVNGTAFETTDVKPRDKDLDIKDIWDKVGS